MSRLNELIQELCPDGVELKRLGDQQVCVMQRGTVITKNSIIMGEIPVIAGGKNPAYYCNQANRTGETITIAGSGAYAGFISYWNIPIFVSDAFSIKGTELCSTKYLYYLLLNMQDKIYATKKGAGIPHVHIKDVENFKIPIPPLDVQNEIVRILDTFTSHAAELQAELQARKEQYEYYRNKLLTFEKDDKNVKWVKLKEYAEIGTGSSNTQDELSIGLYPFFVRSQIVRRNNEYEFDETAIITSGDGVGVGKIFHYVEGKYALHQRAYRIHVLNEKIIPKFLFHYMRCEFYNYITKNAYTSSVTSIRKPMLLNFPIPILSMSEQQRIVSILDKFEALVNDLTEGLPAEIAAVQEQYEYYRNKLLTFKDVGTYHGASST